MIPIRKIVYVVKRYKFSKESNLLKLNLMKRKHLILTSILSISLGLVSMSYLPNAPQEKWEVPEEYENMKNPYADSKDEDQIGRTMYSKYCKNCHGNKGKGDGVTGKLLNPKPADFTSDIFKLQSDGSMYYKIKTGRGLMSSYEKIITEEEDLWMVINYIKNL